MHGLRKLVMYSSSNSNCVDTNNKLWFTGWSSKNFWIEIYDQNTCKFHQQTAAALLEKKCMHLQLASFEWTFSNRNLLCSHWQFMRQFEIVVVRSKSSITAYRQWSQLFRLNMKFYVLDVAFESIYTHVHVCLLSL